MSSDTPNGTSSVNSVNPNAERVVESDKVWTTLITNTEYLSGLLTLDASLKFAGSKYPLVALYTDTFPQEGKDALDQRKIPRKHIPYLLPKTYKDFTNDPRFYDCWSKLTPFSLVEYERVVQLDSDMLVLQNMDELMDISLDGREEAGQAQHGEPEKAQVEGMPSDHGITMPNGGLQVVVPCPEVYEKISNALQDEKTMSYDFSDQSLLGDVFHGRWVALPYVYNALKTLRWKGVHDPIWRDDRVKNIHYILSPKPWDENEADKKKQERDGSNQWWWDVHERRLKEERAIGIDDGF
ncbi:hypothetical protein LTR37_004992 [Vermiconidia calcicola]|uniref:Uncharacterized protein n=1 Tax=Vermiconidia calcicola TaxID=1690605 RepID=A0ACC3NLI7_9PEZI|nr:hypothetical protein LTR37_004992 [Vermiconidia calcicola]